MRRGMGMGMGMMCGPWGHPMMGHGCGDYEGSEDDIAVGILEKLVKVGDTPATVKSNIKLALSYGDELMKQLDARENARRAERKRRDALESLGNQKKSLERDVKEDDTRMETAKKRLAEATKVFNALSEKDKKGKTNKFIDQKAAVRSAEDALDRLEGQKTRNKKDLKGVEKKLVEYTNEKGKKKPVAAMAGS